LKQFERTCSWAVGVTSDRLSFTDSSFCSLLPAGCRSLLRPESSSFARSHIRPPPCACRFRCMCLCVYIYTERERERERERQREREREGESRRSYKADQVNRFQTTLCHRCASKQASGLPHPALQLHCPLPLLYAHLLGHWGHQPAYQILARNRWHAGLTLSIVTQPSIAAIGQDGQKQE